MKLLYIILIFVNIITAKEYNITNISGVVKVNNKSINIPINVQSKDIINISKGSLTFSNGVVYSKSGNYSVSKIQLLGKINKHNVNSKLANSLIDELSKSSDMLESSGDMLTLGAVERGFSSGSLGYPFNTYIYGDTVTLFWDFKYPVNLEITDEIGNVIYNNTISNNNLFINLDSLGIGYNQLYCWSIETETYCLQRVREPLQINIDNQILVAIFYKKNKYLVDYYRVLKTLSDETKMLMLETE